MEAKGGSQRWKMHLSEFEHSRRFPGPTTEDSERGKTERTHNSVTMAPSFRCLTDQHYVVRRPLFSQEQYGSILKKTQSQKEKLFGVARKEETQQQTDMSCLTRAELTLESCRPSPSAYREDLGSPLAVSKLRRRPDHEETTFESLSPRSTLVQGSLSNSILEVQRLNPPLRPPLTSTVLYPTYTPRSGHSRTDQTLLTLGGRGEDKLCSSGGRLKGHSMSPYQANYWACAIPKDLPPSPDRKSADWDPNREYQDLLDYTYPLRPGQMVTKWDSSNLQENSHIEPNLQDSGIGLDHLCSSTSLSRLGFTVCDTGQSRNGGTLSVDDRSPHLPTVTKSCTQVSQTDQVGLSLDSQERSENRGDVHLHQHRALPPAAPPDFIRSTSVLPRSRRVCGEMDEEFWPLPVQLKELQLLSRQVREVTDQLSQPVNSSWESLGPGTTAVLSSITLLEKQEAEDREEETEVNSKDKDGGKSETDKNKTSAAQTADHSDSNVVRRRSRAWVEPVGGGLSLSSLKKGDALAEQLCSLALPSSQSSSQENQYQSDSLMQHIQVFCSHLEQLIQQLYTVSEKMELQAMPTVDTDGVKSSLAEYQSFQREVSSHQPVTSSVVHTGQLLLSCINTMSPFLRDTLLLIDKQSGALENPTEHFFSSIRSAMDSLIQPGAVQQSRDEGPGLVRVQGSAL